jgi:hypothetical protein
MAKRKQIATPNGGPHSDHLQAGMFSALPRVILRVVELLAIVGESDPAHHKSATLRQRARSKRSSVI